MGALPPPPVKRPDSEYHEAQGAAPEPGLSPVYPSHLSKAQVLRVQTPGLLAATVLRKHQKNHSNLAYGGVKNRLLEIQLTGQTVAHQQASLLRVVQE